MQEEWVSRNRSARKWSRREQIGRVLWALAQPLFRFSPRPFWSWRRRMLKLFGAKVGSGVHIFPTACITIPWNLSLGDNCAIGDHVILYALGPITVGARATVSQNAHLCAGSHDYRQSDMPLIKPAISIGTDCWVAADAFVGPGVTIGDRAILGARAVTTKDVPDGTVAVGNPAKVISKRKESENPRG